MNGQHHRPIVCLVFPVCAVFAMCFVSVTAVNRGLGPKSQAETLAVCIRDTSGQHFKKEEIKTKRKISELTLPPHTPSSSLLCALFLSVLCQQKKPLSHTSRESGAAPYLSAHTYSNMWLVCPGQNSC